MDEIISNISGNIEDRAIRIKIIGVGGAGNNAVDRLKLDNLGHVDLAVVNTDSKTLSVSPIHEKLMIGRTITRGLSAGGEADIGKQAAEADKALLEKLVDGVDLVFLLAGLGGGTGSGAAPVIAEVASAAGAVVIAFVTQPFTREGARRQKQAEDSLTLLRSSCHAVIALPNDVLLQQVDENANLMEAFALADEWISRGVGAIWSMLFQNGLINVDFATLQNAFRFRGGKTLFGIGTGQGEDCVRKALADLELCPLLHLPEYRYSRRADSLIVNVTGGTDLSLSQVHQIMDTVCEKFGSRDNTVLGALIDDELQQEIRITVIGATDLGTGSGKGTRLGVRRPVSVSTPVASPVDRGPEIEVPYGTPKDASVVPGTRAQDEFDFPREEESRGFFEKTEANLYNGEDLDVPTFLRRGIKITL